MKQKIPVIFFIILVLPFTQTAIKDPESVLAVFNKQYPQNYNNLFQPQNTRHPPSKTNSSQLYRLVRTIDGSQNNKKNTNLGKSHTNMPRLTQAAYVDGKGKMIDRGNPRQLSNIIGSIGKNEQVKRNQYGLNMLFVLYGQFVDHDLDLVLSSKAQPVPIKVPKGDSFFDPDSSGDKTIQFSRSKFTQVNGKRTMANQLTSFIDGSQVYGSDESTAKNLRSFNSGKLKMTNNMLIKDSNGGFVAGDFRVNQNIGLTAIQTIFARQHNRQCDLLANKYSSLNDQQLFQFARNKVIGLIQKITYKEYLPLLLGKIGYQKYIGGYKGYNESVDPTVNIQFATAAFRIGHPLLSESLTLFNYNNEQIRTIMMKDLFLSFKTLKSSQDIDFTTNGMIRTQCKHRNNQLVDGVRNSLEQIPSLIQDLFSVNVQRGRDNGVPDYNTVRRLLSLKTVKSFSQISSNRQTVSRLSRAYQSPDNIDLWVGIISQNSLPGGNLGQVGAAIVGQTFKRIRNGDRFWYEYAYPKDQINQIQNTSLLDVIQRNTKLRDISEVFKIPHISKPKPINPIPYKSIIQLNNIQKYAIRNLQNSDLKNKNKNSVQTAQKLQHYMIEQKL